LSKACECWFLDVGQGSSNVIMLEGNRAVVIDCGPRGSRETVTLLKEKHVQTIECLAITHNHEDHDGNVAQVLCAYSGAVRSICFLNDGNRNLRTLAMLNSDSRNERWPPARRLETEGSRPAIIYEDTSFELSAIHPSMQDNLNALQANQTSAVLLLKAWRFRLLFSGDVTLSGWMQIASRLKSPPLKCDFMTVPHHGGNINGGVDERASHDTLYRHIVNTQHAIISVGTSNAHGHPTMDALVALRDNHVNVMCTQMTANCCSDLERVRDVARVIQQPARSTRHADYTSSARKSKNVACFGTIAVELNAHTYTIEPDPDSIPICFAGTSGLVALCRQGD